MAKAGKEPTELRRRRDHPWTWVIRLMKSGSSACKASSINGAGHILKTPYQWVIEGDIKGCFDNIDHHQLMKRVRTRVADGKVTRLIAQFLKAGVLSDG